MTTVRVVAPVDAQGLGARVRRFFPQHAVDAVGPWIYADEVGPAADWVVPAHPLGGVQSLLWVWDGRIAHTDGTGTACEVDAGQGFLTTAGSGVVVRTSSVGAATRCLTLGLALPAASRMVEPAAEPVWPEPVRVGDHEVAIIVGEFGYEDSPARTLAPALAAEVRFASEEPLAVPVEDGWAYAVLTDDQPITVNDEPVDAASLACVEGDTLILRAQASAGRVVRALVLGGPPVEGAAVTWWGLRGGSDADIRAWADAWERSRTGEGPLPLPPATPDGSALASPPLPPGRLIAR